MTVHILIVTFNATSWLETCIPPRDTLPPGWKVVVVDNASTDDTVALLKQHYAHAQLIESSTNLGFGGGNNLGLSSALREGADHIFLLNQDAYIDIAGIQKLIALQREHPDHLILSPLQLDGPGAELDFGFAPLCAPEICPELMLDALNGRLRTVYEALGGVAAAWLLSRAALERIGGFNPLFFHYGEDEDYVKRVLYHGYKVGIAPHLRAVHHRIRKERGRRVEARFIDTLIEAADPAGEKNMLPKLAYDFFRVLRRYATKGKFSSARVWAMRHIRLLRPGFLANRREELRREGPHFLDNSQTATTRR